MGRQADVVGHAALAEEAQPRERVFREVVSLRFQLLPRGRAHLVRRHARPVERQACLRNGVARLVDLALAL